MISAVLAVTLALTTVEKFNRFDEVPVSAIRPQGHLKSFLESQVAGLTGHPERLGYPFNTKMWEGPINKIVFTEGLYNGRDEVKSGDTKDFWTSGMWWPYEQTAYLLDGMARVSAFVDAPELDAIVKRNLDWVYAHANPTNGDLFTSLSASSSQWPLVVLSRAALAQAEKSGDFDAFIKYFGGHYAGKKDKRMKWILGSRDGLNIEGMLKVMEFTGDRSLLEDAKLIYERSMESKRFGKKRHIIEHGVTLAETLKIPVILYVYTGDEKYLIQAKAALENIYAMDEQADGLFSANEFTSGRDPRQGHETCVTADMMWTLGYFVEADVNVKAADRMERIAYNALPGSCTKDFRRHQYLSAVNQVVCDPFANNSHFNFGEATWRQYRSAHFPQCCTGNISRSMPSFVRRMWLKDRKKGCPVAMLYGPCEFTGEKDGTHYTIIEKTNYPYEEKIVFELKAEVPMELSILCRVPTWSTREDAGCLVPVSLTTSAPTVLELPAEYTVESDRNWHWVRRGPLTYSFAPPSEVTEENPGDKFSALRIRAVDGEWNYAFDVDEVKSALKGQSFSTQITIPVRRIREWQTLDGERFTPDVPLFVHETGERAEITLVPYGSTLQRITCFPDTQKRSILPVVAVYTSGALYPYTETQPLSEQVAPPEQWAPDQFCKYEWEAPRREDGFADLGVKFKGEDIAGKLGYLTFRVWSDEEVEDATWCLTAGYEVQAFIDGEEVYRTDGMTDPTLMAPVWIHHPIKKGYNFMTVKLSRPNWLVAQYLPFWGAKLEVWKTEKVSNKSEEVVGGSFAEFDRKARAGEPLTVVFFGGSLTWSANASDPNVTGFRGLMADYFLKKYPRVQFRFVDAAIGGTGSNLGMFRLERDVFSHHPDLVFLDFICNDGGENRDSLATCCYEYLLREIIGRGIPVVQMFFTFKWYVEGGGLYTTRHPRILDYRKLVEAYSTGVGDVYTDSTILTEDFNRVWPIDGGHPGDFGYALFASAAKRGYERAVTQGTVCKVPDRPVFGTARDVRRMEPSTGRRDLNYRNSAWFDGLAARWQDGVKVFTGGNVERCEFSAPANFVGIFGEGDDQALKYDLLADGTKVASFDGSPHVGAPLYTWRYHPLNGWNQGKPLAKDFSLMLKASNGDKGELRVASLCTAVIVPNDGLTNSTQNGDFTLEAIDHARGKKQMSK